MTDCYDPKQDRGPVRDDGTPGFGLRERFDQTHFMMQETFHLHTLWRRVTLYEEDPSNPEGLNLSPEYQRGHVWTITQSENFMGHLLTGGQVPMTILRMYPSELMRADEVLDGKQRFTAIMMWLRGEISARLGPGDYVHWSDLNAAERRWITGISGPALQNGYVRGSQAEILRLYVKFNRGGTVHSSAEISRVRAMIDQLETVSEE